MLRNVAELQERLQEIHDKNTALFNVAKDGKRDFTDEEAETFDARLAEADEIKKTHLPRAQALENEEERLAKSAGRKTGLMPTNLVIGDNQPDRIVIPATARTHRNLRAFHGEDAELNAYKSGQFIRATLWGNSDSRQWCQDNGMDIRAAQTEGSDPKGGYLVPIEMERSIIALVEEYGLARNKMNVKQMSSDTQVIPRRLSGLTAYYVGEGASITESDKTWDQVQLVARKLAVIAKYSSELSEDAIISIADDLAGEIARQFAIEEDQALFLGDGTSTYGGQSGLITECAAATATVVTAATANTAFSTLDFTDFESMVGKLPDFTGIDPEWYISKPGYYASMARLLDAAGGNTIAILEGGVSQRQFLGYPVNFAKTMNSTLTAQTSTDGICYFGDLNMAATFGERRGITIAVDGSVYFTTDMLAIRGTERYHINVHDVGTTSVAGAVIMLSTPSS